MDIESRIRYALNYPFEGEESKYKPILIGGLFVVLSPFIIPFFTIFGYQLRVYEASIEKRPRPEFSGILALTKEGFIATLVLIPAFILVGILTSVPNLFAMAGVAPEALTAPVTFFLVVLSTFISPIFLAMYVDTRSFSDTYDLSRVLSILRNRDYLLQMVLFTLLSGLLQIGAVLGSLFLITIPFISMFVVIVSSAYLGDMFRPYLDQTR